MTKSLVIPLRKKTTAGKLYNRNPVIESRLQELLPLSRERLAMQCGVKERDNPAYIPTECLLYFVRACRHDGSDEHFARLYKLLAERVLRTLPCGESLDGEKVALKESLVREKAFDRFIEMLASDRQSYSEKLDYFEIRFDSALKTLRLDALDQVWPERNRLVSIDLDDSGELSPEVELAVGTFNPFDSAELDAANYRLRLNVAIETLPRQQRTIVEMIRQEIPIDSKDPEAITIARILGKSEKTIRTHRDMAFATLRGTLKKEEAA